MFFKDEYFSVETMAILPKTPHASFSLTVGEVTWQFSVVCGWEVRNEKMK